MMFFYDCYIKLLIFVGLNGENWYFEDYVVCGGYKQLCCIFEEKILFEQVIVDVKVLGLCGCGGVGFLIGLKWSFMLCQFLGQKYFVCNLDEGELGMFKDCDILCWNLYVLIEGMVIGVYVMGIIVGYNYIYGEIFEVY